MPEIINLLSSSPRTPGGGTRRSPQHSSISRARLMQMWDEIAKTPESLSKDLMIRSANGQGIRKQFGSDNNGIISTASPDLSHPSSELDFQSHTIRHPNAIPATSVVANTQPSMAGIRGVQATQSHWPLDRPASVPRSPVLRSSPLKTRGSENYVIISSPAPLPDYGDVPAFTQSDALAPSSPPAPRLSTGLGDEQCQSGAKGGNLRKDDARGTYDNSTKSASQDKTSTCATKRKSLEAIDMTSSSPKRSRVPAKPTLSTRALNSRIGAVISSSPPQEGVPASSRRVYTKPFNGNSSLTRYYGVSKNITARPEKPKSKGKNSAAKNGLGDTLQDDTILFTSDAVDPTTAHEEVRHQQPTSRTSTKRTATIASTVSTSVFDEDDNQRGASHGEETPISLFSDASFELEKELVDVPKSPNSRNLDVLKRIKSLNAGSQTKMARRKRPKDLDLEIDDPDVGKDRGVAPTQTQTKKKSKLTAEERSAQAAEKKREREKEKEARKEQRRREKEERAQLKSLEVDLAEVNKRQSNRKESALELIVDLPVSFDASLKTLVDSAFSAAGVETSYVDSVVPGLITFRRKLAREWDAQTKSFRRIPLRIEPEPYVLCVLKAKQLAQLVWDDVNGDKAVDEFAKKINANFSGFEQVYIIEGLQQYLRSNANRANREFAQRVRGALNQVSASAPQQQPHRQQQQRSRATPDVSGEQIEDRLDHLQMEYYAKIIHTSTASETTLEIQRFAEHISAVRHAPESTTLADAKTSFCLAVGQVTTGSDAPDTYIKMLQQQGHITEPMARDIALEYPGTLALMRAFRTHGPTAIEGVKRTLTKTGAARVRCIGKALSEKVCNSFMGGDPDKFVA